MLTDAQARTIASWWHGSVNSAIYSLSSTGAIKLPNVDREITVELTGTMDVQNEKDLRDLREYVRTKGPRGPVEGWSDIRIINESDMPRIGE